MKSLPALSPSQQKYYEHLGAHEYKGIFHLTPASVRLGVRMETSHTVWQHPSLYIKKKYLVTLALQSCNNGMLLSNDVTIMAARMACLATILSKFLK